jgi:hypothetical protein
MLHLIRTITRIPIHTNQASPLHINMAVLGTDGELPDQLAYSVECMQRVVNADANDCRTLAGGTIDTMRRFGMHTFTPNCGPRCEQADPDILWQKTFDGYDGDGMHLIVNYSVVRSI